MGEDDIYIYETMKMDFPQENDFHLKAKARYMNNHSDHKN